MLLATFRPSTGWVGKTISYENGVFILEDHGAIGARDVLSYDRQGQLEWAYAGLREWVEQTTKVPPPPLQVGQPATLQGQSPSAQAEPRAGVVGFVFALVGFVMPILWIAGLVLSWRDVKRARREARPHGLALAGLIISSIGVGLLVIGLVAAVAIPMFLVQRDKAHEAALKEGIHSVHVGVQSWAADHGGVYPAASKLTQRGLSRYVDDWPINPYTGLPMQAGTSPGDFSYVVSPNGTTYQLSGYGQNGQVVITVP
jgi:type IV pilus assembly protein PilA